MSKNNDLKTLVAAVLCLGTSGSLITAHAESPSSNANPGYSVDGRTSASVLAAKRSHSVSPGDETGLAIVSGLMVIAVIVFFSQKLFNKK